MWTDGDEAGEEPKKRRDAATGTGGVRRGPRGRHGNESGKESWAPEPNYRPCLALFR